MQRMEPGTATTARQEPCSNGSTKRNKPTTDNCNTTNNRNTSNNDKCNSIVYSNRNNDSNGIRCIGTRTRVLEQLGTHSDNSLMAHHVMDLDHRIAIGLTGKSVHGTWCRSVMGAIGYPYARHWY